jgi:predicted kinase
VDYLTQIYACWRKAPKWDDSFEKYADIHGCFVKSRQDVHNEIISNGLKDFKNNGRSVVSFIGGPAASGKSEFIKNKIRTKNKLVINTDAIKMLLPEYRAQQESYLHRESFVVAQHMLYKGLELGIDVVIETTGKGPYELLITRINTIKHYGALIDAHYLMAHYETILQRAEFRQRSTNRYTPPDIIKDSWECVRYCLLKLIDNKIFDSITVWSSEKNNCFVKLLEQKIYDSGAWESLCGGINE